MNTRAIPRSGIAIRAAVALLCLCTLSHAGAADLIANKAAVHSFDSHETMLIEALDDIRSDRIDAALGVLHNLVTVNPKFRLAQLMYADLLMSRVRPINDFGNNYSVRYDQIRSFRDEARARWHHFAAPPPQNRIPDALIKLNDKQSHAIVVDLATSRLYLFENRDGIPRLVNDFYATIGKNGTGKVTEGDGKTPVGVYFVTGFIDSGKLPDFYGDGAFPIDYPNEWDQRNGRTGYGIWLHGTPSYTYSRPPLDSDGCVILTNQDFNLVSKYIAPGETPVVLSNGLTWISVEDWRRRQTRYDALIEQWRKDWESRNADRYLSHYSTSYTGLGKDYKGWVDYKRRVNPSKRYIQIGISEKSILLYPGKVPMLVVTFEQDYDSDDYRRKYMKRQYWRKESDGQWRIVYEGSVS